MVDKNEFSPLEITKSENDENFDQNEVCDNNQVINRHESKPLTCFEYFKNDLRIPFFSLQEPNGNTIDVRATFAPFPTWRTILFRFLLLSLSVVALVIDLLTTPFLWMWMGYLTHWALIYTLLYQCTILICSIWPRLFLRQPDNDNPSLSIFIRFVWIMYALATTTEIAVAILFWGLIYSPSDSITYANVVYHGGTGFFLFIDGNLISKIPIRLKHFVIVESMSIIYLFWNIFHSLEDIGIRKGDDNIGEPLYAILDWQANPKSSTILSVLVLFCLMPMLYLIIWMCSLFSCRCFCDGSSRNTTDDVEFTLLV